MRIAARGKTARPQAVVAQAREDLIRTLQQRIDLLEACLTGLIEYCHKHEGWQDDHPERLLLAEAAMRIERGDSCAP